MVFGLLFKATDAPWQKLLPPFLGEKTAPDEDRCQIALGVKLVGYGGEYEGVVEPRSLGSADRSAKKVIFSAYYYRLDDLPLRNVVPMKSGHGVEVVRAQDSAGGTWWAHSPVYFGSDKQA